LSLLSTNLTANLLWSAFHSVLNSAIEQFVPSYFADAEYKIRHKKSHPRTIKNAIAHKCCLWHTLKFEPHNAKLSVMYHQVTDKCRRLIRTYEMKRENVINSKNRGRFYKYVNVRLANKHGVGTLRDDKGEAVVGNSERADLLNNYCCSVNVTDNGILPNLGDRSGASRLDNASFNPSNVVKAIRKLTPNLSSGPDGYPLSLFANFRLH